MPLVDVRFKPRRDILTFEEMERFVRVAARHGIERLRITGGEPLVRAELPLLIRKLAAIPGIRDLAMTTNGILLAKYARQLKQAGLQRLNISLDGLREETFQKIARREGIARVLEGIAAAQECGFEKIRLNAVAIRDVNDDQIVPLVEFARREALELRFIEFMPLDAEQGWDDANVVSGEEIRRELEDRIGPLRPAPRRDPSQPAIDYEFVDGAGRVGFISSVTQPFCDTCDRLRLTAEGKMHNCLFSKTEWDARALLRGGGSDLALSQLMRACVREKKAGHGTDDPQFLIRPQRAMYQIGG
jgi:cyclic pyranopterin phosphate synthase